MSKYLEMIPKSKEAYLKTAQTNSSADEEAHVSPRFKKNCSIHR